MSTPTRYEIAARTPAGHTFLLGYTPRLSQAGLLAVLQRWGVELIDLMKLDGSENFTRGKEPHLWLALNGWRFEFTGRTQHQARQEGELEFFLPAARAQK